MKTKLFILSVVFSVLCLFGCKPETIAVKEVSLDKVTAELSKGETLQLNVKINPEDAQYKTLEWSSSDNNIATVDQKGLVAAIEKGEAIITVNVDGKTAECGLTVVGVPVESITLDQETITLEKNETAQLVATVLPENADDKTVTWTSSDSNIATVDANGLVTAAAVGQATITASCGSVAANCSVTVNGIQSESITLDKESITLYEGDTEQLTATIHPEDAEDKTVTWTSSDNDIVTVDPNGLVTAISEGSATITATNNDLSATCSVTVKKEEAASGPKVGDYYYSDGTYSSVLDESKEAIAIVFYVGHHPSDESDYSATGIGKEQCNGYAVALTNSGKSLIWGVWAYEVGTAPVNAQGEYYYGDTSGNPNRPDLKLTKDTDWNGYKSTQMIKTAAETDFEGLNQDSDRGFPATYMCLNYMAAPAASSGWFMPSTGQVLTAYEVSKTSENFNVDIFRSFDTYDGFSFWTSSEDGHDDPSQYTYIIRIDSGVLTIDGDYKDYANSYVRPIIAF